MGFLDFLNMDARQVDIPDKKRGPAGTVLHLYTSKLAKNIATNIIFLVANIPSLVITYIAATFALPYINKNFSISGLKELVDKIGLQISPDAAPGTEITSQLFVMVIVFVSFFVVGMTLVSAGPVQTALASIYRNYARKKPVMLWSDFVSVLKKEWKQSLIASIISIVLTGIIVFNIAFYNSTERNTLTEVLFALFLVLFVFLMCIQMYVYPLIASINLKTLQVYRNAAILFVARLPQTVGILLLNVLILAIVPGVMIFSFSSIGMVLAILYYGLFAFSFTHLMNTVFVWTQIERFMVRDESTDSAGAVDGSTDGDTSVSTETDAAIDSTKMDDASESVETDDSTESEDSDEAGSSEN